MRSIYKEHILEHYNDPHNFGEMDDPDADVEAENPSCGDELHLYAKVDDGKIQDLSFTGSGCALSIAAASLLTDELQGVDVDDIKNVSEEDLFELLGLEQEMISPLRMKCVLLCRDAAEQLIEECTR